MAKLVSTVALISFLLLVLLAESSSAYRTIVTTLEIEDATGSRGQSCRQKIQRRDLGNCKQFIRHHVRLPEEALVRRCCDQVQQVRDECQCEAFKYVVEQELQGARQDESQGMKKRAREFPAQCGIQQCQIRVGFF